MLLRRLLMVPIAAGISVAGFANCGSDSADADAAGGMGGRTTSSSSPGGKGGAATGAGTEPVVGRACTGDEQCVGEPYWCLQATASELLLGSLFQRSDIAGGPAGGYCTKTCLEDEDCPDEGSVCLNEPEQEGFCLLGCTFGQPDLSSIWDPLPSDKCQGRNDVMCVPLVGGGAVCVPACGSDSECPHGGCDLSVGLCTASPRTGDPLGVPCTVDNPATGQDEDNCAGLCLEVPTEQEEFFMCSARCSYGGEHDETPNCGGLTSGLCGFRGGTRDEPPVYSGAGDYAFCTRACTKHDECYFAYGLFCYDTSKWDSHHVGHCFLAVECPVGDECEAGYLCTETQFGKVCLQEEGGELLIPLGEAAVGGAGGAGGSGGTGTAGGT